MEPAEAWATGGATGSELELLLASVSDDAILLLDVDGHIRTWNRGAERIKGYTAAEVIGRHFRIFSSDADREARRPEEDLRAAARDGRHEQEGWRYRKDGSRFWANVVITALRDETGTLLGFGKVTRDLTSRRLAEEQLRLTDAELRTANGELSELRRLVTSVRDYAIFMLDAGGHIKTWNTGAEHINGYRADEIIGRHFSIFYTAEDRLRDHPAEELVIAAREGRFEEEGWRLRKDGSRFWANVLITAVRDEEGVLVGFSKVTRDLTSRRAAQEELHRTQERLKRSNAELERFAAVAAHDLREPLASVAALGQLLGEREGGALSEGGREMLGQIAGSLAHMQELVEGLLRYARLDDAPAAETVNLTASIGRVLTGLRAQIEERDAVVEVDVPADATLHADRFGVDVLLQNIVSNALKFGGAERPHVAVVARRAPHGWRVTVTDNGPGIPSERQEQIFGAFERLPETRRAPGTGLGLAICARVVERSGGEIGVESAPGGGSTFWFVLPAPA